MDTISNTFSKLSFCFLLLLFCQCEMGNDNQQVVEQGPEIADEQATVDSSASLTSTEESTPLIREEIQQFEVKNPLPKWPAKRDFREYKLYPFDEAVNDESLLRFRQQLYEAVKRRNVSHLLASCSDKIKFSFGMENGKSAFIESWKLDKPQADTSGIWTELENVLSLGGAFIDPDKEVFLAPYQSVVDDFTDPFSEGVITGENVRLRDQPSVEGKIIASLSWDKVSIIFQDNAKSETIGGQTHYWEKVRNAKEQIGYVWGKYLGYSAGYRAAFEKEEGEWKMVTFIAGD